MKIEVLKLTRMLRIANQSSDLRDLPYLARDILFYIAEIEGNDDVIVNDIMHAFRDQANVITLRNHFAMLEDNGFAKRREPTRGDKRFRYVVLTPKGKAAIKSYADALAAAA